MIVRHGRYSLATDQDVVILIQQPRQALAVVLNGLLFFVCGSVAAIAAGPQILCFFIEDISNLS